jgi:Uma2 family endonuclease
MPMGESMSVIPFNEQRRYLQEVLEPPYLLRRYEATPANYEELCDEDLKCEFIDGELIVHSPASVDHEDLNLFIGALLREYVSRRALGRTFGPNAVMQIGERRFCPDASVLLNANAGRIVAGRCHGPMDLVVEVISNSTRAYDHLTKLPAYREAGIGEIWLVDEERRLFEVYFGSAGVYSNQTLSKGNWPSQVLPGLGIDVEWFWTRPLPSIQDCLSE